MLMVFMKVKYNVKFNFNKYITSAYAFMKTVYILLVNFNIEYIYVSVIIDQ